MPQVLEAGSDIMLQGMDTSIAVYPSESEYDEYMKSN